MDPMLVADKFLVGHKIGEGSWGVVYLGTHMLTGEKVAIKTESAYQDEYDVLREARVYGKLAGGDGIPYVHWSGTDHRLNYMVMDLLDISLAELFEMCDRRFSLQTVLKLADQILTRLEFVHSRQYVHRDLKPQNFMLGRFERRNQIVMIDFGLAQRWSDTEEDGGLHIPYHTDMPMVGTARYSSIHSHAGIESSRRDDMESLGYLLVYFLRGSLPWQGQQSIGMESRSDVIMRKKLAISPEQLCLGFPDAFAVYLTYARGLLFQAEPDYRWARQLFRRVYQENGFKPDAGWDWDAIRRQP